MAGRVGLVVCVRVMRKRTVSMHAANTKAFLNVSMMGQLKWQRICRRKEVTWSLDVLFLLGAAGRRVEYHDVGCTSRSRRGSGENVHQGQRL